MTSEEMYKDRFKIVFEALAEGLRVEYKHGWFLLLDLQKQELMQVYQDGDREVIHKSAVALNDFMKFINEVSIPVLKRLYGDIRLTRLQNKLERENGGGNEE